MSAAMEAWEDDFDFTPENELSKKPTAVAKRRSRLNNPVHARLRWRIDRNNQRARKSDCTGSLSIREWLAILDASNWQCACCGEAGELEIDHIQPLESKGANRPHNIQPLCSSCNKLKGKETIDYRKKAS